MGRPDSANEESFEDGLLEQPQYTRPRDWEGLEIPEVLFSGDHRAMARWKRQQREALTATPPARSLGPLPRQKALIFRVDESIGPQPQKECDP